MTVTSPSRLSVLRSTLGALGQYAFQRSLCALGSSKPRSDQPHLLLLAWLFPPKISGGVYRPLSFVRHAVERGWKVTVVAGPLTETPSAAGEYLARQLPANVQVLRLNQSQRIVSYKAFPRIDGGFLNVLSTFDLVRNVLDIAPTVIVPTGPPFHNFAAGWMLSRYYRVPLALDYRDEWTECPFSFVQIGNADLAWERRCLKSAAAVTMTTDSFIEHALVRFPQLTRDRVHKVMNGWDPADMPDGKAPEGARRDDTIEIAYLGALGDHAPISGLLADMTRLAEREPELARRVVLRFVGTRTTRAATMLAEFKHRWMIRLDGQVPKPEALRAMRSASALLIINEPELARYIPGKLFDYIASETPILVYGDGGEASQIVGHLDAGVVIKPGDVDGLHSLVEKLDRRQLDVDRDKARTWLTAHTRQQSAATMMDVLERISMAA